MHSIGGARGEQFAACGEPPAGGGAHGGDAADECVFAQFSPASHQPASPGLASPFASSSPAHIASSSPGPRSWLPRAGRSPSPEGGTQREPGNFPPRRGVLARGHARGPPVIGLITNTPWRQRRHPLPRSVSIPISTLAHSSDRTGRLRRRPVLPQHRHRQMPAK